ncbi:MAG TPA: glycosyl hydrolase [Polyangiaceae bacterium]
MRREAFKLTGMLVRCPDGSAVILLASLAVQACSNNEGDGHEMTATGGTEFGGTHSQGGAKPVTSASSSVPAQGGTSPLGTNTSVASNGGAAVGGASSTAATSGIAGAAIAASSSTGGVRSASGGAATGGVKSAGGGVSTGGVRSASGGAATGGVRNASAGAATGGVKSSAGAAGSNGGSINPKAPYKGIANSPANQLASLGATWCYNWGTTPKASDCNDPYFVPMVWGPGDVAGAIKAIGNAGYTTVLGFNEPNKSDQANMAVADALDLWPALTSNPNIRVSSPAVSDDGRSWLQNFMTQAKAKGLRVDFIAMHWYGWNSGSCVASQLEGAVNWASQWGLPIWITEFGCMGTSNTDEQTVIKFFNDAVTMLAKHPLVERYAWYPWNTYNHLYEDTSMTDLGKAFTAAPQYRQ